MSVPFHFTHSLRNKTFLTWFVAAALVCLVSGTALSAKIPQAQNATAKTATTTPDNAQPIPIDTCAEGATSITSKGSFKVNVTAHGFAFGGDVYFRCTDPTYWVYSYILSDGTSYPPQNFSNTPPYSVIHFKTNAQGGKFQQSAEVTVSPKNLSTSGPYTTSDSVSVITSNKSAASISSPTGSSSFYSKIIITDGTTPGSDPTTPPPGTDPTTPGAKPGCVLSTPKSLLTKGEQKILDADRKAYQSQKLHDQRNAIPHDQPRPNLHSGRPMFFILPLITNMTRKHRAGQEIPDILYPSIAPPLDIPDHAIQAGIEDVNITITIKILLRQQEGEGIDNSIIINCDETGYLKILDYPGQDWPYKIPMNRKLSVTLKLSAVKFITRGPMGYRTLPVNLTVRGGLNAGDETVIPLVLTGE